jgi:hypothetical protein
MHHIIVDRTDKLDCLDRILDCSESGSFCDENAAPASQVDFLEVDSIDWPLHGAPGDNIPGQQRVALPTDNSPVRDLEEHIARISGLYPLVIEYALISTLLMSGTSSAVVSQGPMGAQGIKALIRPAYVSLLSPSGRLDTIHSLVSAIHGR